MPASGAECAPLLSVDRSTARPEGSALQATKQARRRWQAIEQRIGENPCEAVPWVVCLAFQSHFRIIAWAGVALIADLVRERRMVRECRARLPEAECEP